ncbi:MAG: hypothetical protein ITG02_01540 [Patulibacter sp.]|nr:hypothetical protein [Patulibacter sp.]
MRLLGLSTTAPVIRPGDVPLAVTTEGVVVGAIALVVLVMIVTGWIAGRARSRARYARTMASLDAAERAIAERERRRRSAPDA